MPRAALINPASGVRVVFEISPSEEQQSRRVRTVTRARPAASGWRPVTPTLQQGARGPLTKQFNGLAPSRAQHEMLLAFRRLSESQTVIFEDPDGNSYEVQVTTYEPTRRSVVRGPRGGSEVWGYSLTLQVMNTTS
jgi:hypothetical protein